MDTVEQVEKTFDELADYLWRNNAKVAAEQVKQAKLEWKLRMHEIELNNQDVS